MALSTLDVVVCLASVCALHLIYSSKKQPIGTRLPGPPGLPLIGNLRDIPDPKGFPWLAYSQWGKQYDSDVVRLSALGTNIVILNTVAASMDLLEKRSSIYSDRPQFVMLSELIGCGWGLAFRPYGSGWRDTRKAFHLEMHPHAVKRFRPTEVKATQQFLQKLLHEPEKFMDHTRYWAGVIIMKIAYGIDISDENDPFIKIGERGVEVISDTTSAGAFLVDIVPALKHLPEWFPGASFQKIAKDWSRHIDAMRNKPYQAFKQQLAEGQNPECIAASLLEGFGQGFKDTEYMEDIVTSALGSMYAGGADTTVSSLGSFFLAMVLHPEIQVKAQKEIDMVVGNGRLPDFSDAGSLPYVEAIVREILRWNPVLPMGVPHRSTTDDIYNGYLIPEGSFVMTNSWAMLHDEAEYPNPLEFNPDRFIKDGKLDPNVRDPGTIAFGFGRRICPGRFMGKESLWLSVAGILATLNISNAIGKDGLPIIPDGEYHRSLLCHPKAFPCSIKPRSKDHETLIQSTSAE